MWQTLIRTMVAVKDNSPQLTPEEYFVWEEKQLENYEYIDGQVYAMGGGSVNHRLIKTFSSFGTTLTNKYPVMAMEAQIIRAG